MITCSDYAKLSRLTYLVNHRCAITSEMLHANSDVKEGLKGRSRKIKLHSDTIGLSQTKNQNTSQRRYKKGLKKKI